MVKVTINSKSKKWYMSKLLWIGVLTALSGLALDIAGELSTGIPITVLGIVNVTLRWYTRQEITVN